MIRLSPTALAVVLGVALLVVASDTPGAAAATPEPGAPEPQQPGPIIPPSPAPLDAPQADGAPADWPETPPNGSPPSTWAKWLAAMSAAWEIDIPTMAGYVRTAFVSAKATPTPEVTAALGNLSAQLAAYKTAGMSDAPIALVNLAVAAAQLLSIGGSSGAPFTTPDYMVKAIVDAYAADQPTPGGGVDGNPDFPTIRRPSPAPSLVANPEKLADAWDIMGFPSKSAAGLAIVTMSSIVTNGAAGTLSPPLPPLAYWAELGAPKPAVLWAAYHTARTMGDFGQSWDELAPFLELAGYIIT